MTNSFLPWGLWTDWLAVFSVQTALPLILAQLFLSFRYQLNVSFLDEPPRPCIWIWIRPVMLYCICLFIVCTIHGACVIFSYRGCKPLWQQKSCLCCSPLCLDHGEQCPVPRGAQQMFLNKWGSGNFKNRVWYFDKRAIKSIPLDWKFWYKILSK